MLGPQEVSVTAVIRSKNEIATIGRVIRALRAQTLRRFELLVVDNASTDGTLELARREADRVVVIEEFTHARSTNLAIQEATGQFVYLTNGHSFPDHPDLLETASRLMATDGRLAGLYGRCRPHAEPGRSNTFERVVALAGELTWPRTFTLERRFRPAMLQTQSAMFRRTLALEVPFREIRAGGGEDSLFAMEVLHRGYVVGYHPALDVRHSHGGSNRLALRRFLGYREMIAEAKAEAERRGVPASIRGR